MILIIVFVIWIGASVLVGNEAQKRERNPFVWAFLSIILSPLIGFIALVVIQHQYEVDRGLKETRFVDPVQLIAGYTGWSPEAAARWFWGILGFLLGLLIGLITAF